MDMGLDVFDQKILLLGMYLELTIIWKDYASNVHCTAVYNSQHRETI